MQQTRKELFYLQLQHSDAIVFDLDGTLLDTEKAAGEAVQMAVAKFGKTFTWDLNQRILGQGTNSWTPLVLDELSISREEMTPEDLTHAWEANLERLYPRLPPTAGSPEFLKLLQSSRPDLQLAIATSSNSKAVQAKRASHADLFDPMHVIVCGNDAELEAGKPAPDIYLLAHKRLQEKAKKAMTTTTCIAFEDSLAGVQAAKSAGMFVVAIPDARLEKSQYEALADLVLDAFTDLL